MELRLIIRNGKTIFPLEMQPYFITNWLEKHALYFKIEGRLYVSGNFFCRTVRSIEKCSA
jgi:hypothetical protein